MTVQSETLSYYDEHAGAFAASTVGVDFSATQERFEKLLEPGASILDFGCGSGRDSLRFLRDGFQVTAIDGSEELCDYASKLTGLKVRNELFSELEDTDAYDGIWACSSILHVPKSELGDVFCRMHRALKKNGVLYTSFKYGDFEGMRHGRYFSDFTEASFTEFIEEEGKFSVEDSWVSADVRAGRENEWWLNLVLRRV